ncbi:hypothetical protein M9Y10_013365 [Tritrichomonas musculus]|uniref:Uncharacterized protein n=1 Tax=Tritrichomonas musculus TaxID=1915356 RepID=A0ABR2I7Y3_9EUKA
MGFNKFLKNLIREGIIGHELRHVFGAADFMTNGLARKFYDNTITFMNNNTKNIGILLNTAGNTLLKDSIRNGLSSISDEAIKWLPNSKLKSTLKKINNVAQGRLEDYKKIKQMPKFEDINEAMKYRNDRINGIGATAAKEKLGKRQRNRMAGYQ